MNPVGALEISYNPLFKQKARKNRGHILTGCCPNRDLATTPLYDEIVELLVLPVILNSKYV